VISQPGAGTQVILTAPVHKTEPPITIRKD